MKEYENEQEKFWSGEFGDEYINRNRSDILNAANLNLFSRILKSTYKVGSVADMVVISTNSGQ